MPTGHRGSGGPPGSLNTWPDADTILVEAGRSTRSNEYTGSFISPNCAVQDFLAPYKPRLLEERAKRTVVPDRYSDPNSYCVCKFA
ncbi:hypothetical protein N7468_009578 [Penicillium chermesinum]|uniref:Uncharacterized protein n=1 Tax=Penicillium chermesinum TaxID=63820 RepID=A0A9W9NKJ9_9EURO|nr:uncharacterized protein N7468_009578 [Penicillium chermesinum]KAJ5220374.1 hypothetical protein N7468_009578 [Penicillium chermesinum]